VINDTVVVDYKDASAYNNIFVFSRVPHQTNFSLSGEEVGGFAKNEPDQAASYVYRNVNSFNLRNGQENSFVGDKHRLGEIMFSNVEDAILPEEITFKPERSSNHSNQEAVGCPYYYDWCMTTPAVFLWQFLLGTFFIAVGYPICNVMSYSIYSKILGPKPQVCLY
jgi:hypothetical protein